MSTRGPPNGSTDAGASADDDATDPAPAAVVVVGTAEAVVDEVPPTDRPGATALLSALTEGRADAGGPAVCGAPVPVVVVADPESAVRCSTNTVVVTTAATTRNAAPAINHPRRADPERCDGGYEGCPGGGAYGPTGGT